MENDNNKMTSLTCGETYRPDNTACLDCGENTETLEQYGKCRKMYKSLDEAHWILEDVGLDAESRACLLRKKQLVAVALLAEQDKTLGGLNKNILNKLAKENRLLEIAQAHAQGVMTTLKANQILKDMGLDADSRNCLAKNKQLIEMALLAKKVKEFSGLEKSVINELAKESRLLEIARAHAQGLMTILKAHQILKDIGLDVDYRNCLAKRSSL